MRCVVTGSTGFIGRTLVSVLAQQHEVANWSRDTQWFDLNDEDEPSIQRWASELQNIDIIVHLAALVHQAPVNGGAEEFAHYLRINRDGTLRLAAAAIKAGVRRFIFLSTAKVCGEGGDSPYSPDSVAQPQDHYAQSKWEAEQGLLELARHSPLEVVIIRPPLVYGTDARANFAQLLRLARSPLPLPTARINNRRSMIGIDNLVDFIVHCIHCPAAANGTWLCADQKPYSLSEIISTARRVYEKPSRQFAVPSVLLKTAITALLGAPAVPRLLGNFELDTRLTEHALDWSPPFDMADILRRGQLAR